MFLLLCLCVAQETNVRYSVGLRNSGHCDRHVSTAPLGLSLVLVLRNCFGHATCEDLHVGFSRALSSSTCIVIVLPHHFPTTVLRSAYSFCAATGLEAPPDKQPRRNRCDQKWGERRPECQPRGAYTGSYAVGYGGYAGEGPVISRRPSFRGKRHYHYRKKNHAPRAKGGPVCPRR